MANEGLGWDPLLKMLCHPGGDWHPGRGDNPTYSCTRNYCKLVETSPRNRVISANLSASD